MLNRRMLLASGAALAAGIAPARAQDFPSRPIKIVVPLAAGGMADILARVVALKLTEAGHTTVVENRTGGSGVIGADQVAKSAPDGYTLLMGLHATQAILVHLQKLPYDPAKDFAPVIHCATVPNVLLVNNAVPAASLKDLIAYAKANPGKLTFASQGNGSTGHMIGEQFKAMAGIEITHVPYRGAAPASQDLLAGHVSMLFDIVPLAVSNLQSGKVKALAVCATSRVKVLPDVPTIAEAGLPGMEAGAWFGRSAGESGSARGSCQHAVRHRAARRIEPAERKGEGARGLLSVSRESPARCADYRRGRIARHGGGRVVRAVCAGRHAAGRNCVDQSRGEEGLCFAGDR